MKIYTLTFTDTQKSFSPWEVKSFASKSLANIEMLEQISEKTGISIETLAEGYNKNGLCVGYDFATDSNAQLHWEIFETELSWRETIIGNLITLVHDYYVVPKRFDDTLYDLISEYSDNQLNAITSEKDFIEENLIGEALYQNACAAIGGKNDEKTYAAIIDYLNSDDFRKKEIPEFWELSKNENEILENQSCQRWFLFMLIICSHEMETFTNDVRIAIDENRPQNDKLFATERRKFFLEQYKYTFCPKHRELCSKLTDEQYFSIMEKYISHVWHFVGNKENLNVVIEQFYEEAKYYVWCFIKKYGIDDLLDDWGVIDICQLSDNSWDFEFVEEAHEVAKYVENLKKNYNL